MNKIDSNAIAAAFDSVHEFNDISGQLQGDMVKGVDLSLSLIWEEYQESLEALEKAYQDNSQVFLRDYEEELLDGACDLFVVTMGFLQKLKVAGFNVEEALMRVCKNNMEKFPAVIPPQDYNWYENNGLTVTRNADYGRFVIKDSNMKTRKPVDFQPVVLVDLVPATFFEGLSNG